MLRDCSTKYPAKNSSAVSGPTERNRPRPKSTAAATHDSVREIAAA